MRFKYDSNQDFQIKAINSVISLFNGQPSSNDIPNNLGSLGTIGNRINLENNRILLNRDVIQKENNIPPSLKTDDLDFSIEMETGTGKTYTYFRTIFELNIKYGWTKFIIIVPSVAIKEGVLKTYQNTRDHFDTLYSGLVSNCYEYDSKRPNQIRTFGRERAFGLGALKNFMASVDSGFYVDSGFKVTLRVQRRAPWPYA